MINVNWKNGLRIDVSNETDNQNRFLIVIGEDNIPNNLWEVTNGMFFACFEKFYIEYNVKVYECNIENCEVKLKHETKFNPIDKNFYFELYPKSQEELDIWMSYLDRFADIKKCFLFVKNIDNMKINLSERMKLINDEQEVDFYSQYKISWEDDLNYNPGGILYINSYELINNALMRL